jgi:cell division protein FtsI/penicillin-binding protein 2
MNTFKLRAAIFQWAFLLVLCAIAARLFVIQVVEGGKYAAQSKGQTRQRVVLGARRGTIYDRSGRVLAASLHEDISVNPGILVRAADSPPEHPPAAQNPVMLKRVYPNGNLAGSLLGYTGKDGNGLAGIEYAFDSYLRGEDGWVMLQRDGRNNSYERIGSPKKEPHEGSDVYLTIDLEIQKIVQNVLRQACAGVGAAQAMGIVMEPRSGRILAMADEPTCNPNVPFFSPSRLRINRCIGYNYEPGSTFKLLPAACALQENVIREDGILDGNNGVYEIYNQAIRDIRPYGRLTFAQAVSYSSNVCFAKLADRIGSRRLYEYTRNFGFGAQTGVELPGEETGILHPVEKWSGRTRVTMAIGQELSVTLMQMANLFACIANEGVLVKPSIYEKIVDAGGKTVKSSAYTPIRRTVSAEVARRLGVMLLDVVENGTGKGAAIKGIAVAGKTGTSQKIDSSTQSYSGSLSWASFIGFVPAEDPVILCAVLIDEPRAGHTGGTAAAPCFRNIVRQIISHPDLEFAGRILGAADTGGVPRPAEPLRVPQVCGLTVRESKKLLAACKVPFTVQGTGTHVVYQSCKAGGELAGGLPLVLHVGVPAPDSASAPAAAGNVRVPDCLGKDLREAVETVLRSGLTPYTVGWGMVRLQSPGVGELLKKAEACTLVCSLRG